MRTRSRNRLLFFLEDTTSNNVFQCKRKLLEYERIGAECRDCTSGCKHAMIIPKHKQDVRRHIGK